MKHKLIFSLLILATFSVCANPSVKQQSSDLSTHLPELIPLHQVRLTDGPFYHSQQVNLKYLLALNADRLLAPYLRESGIKSNAESYGNWENSGLDGHIGGHYLSALSLAWAATGNVEIGKRLDYMLSELERAQTVNDGYLGGIPNSDEFWQQIKAGEIRADLFSLNERWVPLYNIDKIFHGLRDAYQLGQREKAKSMLIKLGEWMLDVTKQLSKDQIQQLLYSEHGALNAVFVDMAEISGDQRFLRMAESFTHKSIIEPLSKARDELTGLHANTQIPKVVGALKVANQNNDEDWVKAAEFFWTTVTEHRSIAVGGNSVREHFHKLDDFTAMIEDIEGPETCNTYNMLKLSKLLYLRSGDTRYLDFYERATYNHILSSQHPNHGGLVYFTSMRPGHYRMYSSVHSSMWCCVGSGIENHSKYGELIYAQSPSVLWVNQFIASNLDWQQEEWRISQKTNFPDDSKVKLLFNSNSANPQEFTLRIRHPEWASESIIFSLNNKPINAVQKNGYWIINADWQDGDIITFTLPTDLRAEQLPDGKNYYAIMYGPIALSTKVEAFSNEVLNFVSGDSRMGHIASGPVCPPEALPVILGEPDKFIKNMKRGEGELLYFTTPVKDTGYINSMDKATQLIPFFRLHDSRYQIYWPQMNASSFNDYVIETKLEAERNAQLAALTIDQITPGQQQPEVEHNFKGYKTRAGVNNGYHWRDATGWFEYQLSNPESQAKILRLTYFAGDIGRNFDVQVNGKKLVSVSLPVTDSSTYKLGQEWYYVDYKLPEQLQPKKILRVRFIASKNSVAGGIYGVRLMTNSEIQ